VGGRQGAAHYLMPTFRSIARKRARISGSLQKLAMTRFQGRWLYAGMPDTISPSRTSLGMPHLDVAITFLPTCTPLATPT